MTRTILTIMTIAAAAYAIVVATPSYAGPVILPNNGTSLNGLQLNGINPNGGMFNGTSTAGSTASQPQLQGITLQDGRTVAR